MRWIVFAVMGLFAFSGAAGGSKRPMDTQHSRLTIRVGKEGFFSGAAHDHEISAPIKSGEVDTATPESVAFTVDVSTMKVVDPGVSDSDRAKVQETMLGPTVLDTSHFPEIHFASDKAEKTSDSHWRVHGNLTLHGKTQPIVLETVLENGHYRGSTSLLQTSFGITPIRLAAGTIRVKDELKIEYDIVLAGQ